MAWRAVVSLFRRAAATKQTAASFLPSFQRTFSLRQTAPLLSCVSRGVFNRTFSTLRPSDEAAIAAFAAKTASPNAEPKMYCRFVCKACNHTAQKFISKHSYECGVVLVRCDGCTNLHLIADRLGWFGEGADVHEILRKKNISTASSVIEA